MALFYNKGRCPVWLLECVFILSALMFISNKVLIINLSLDHILHGSTTVNAPKSYYSPLLLPVFLPMPLSEQSASLSGCPR